MYRCIKSFAVSMTDDNGFILENKDLVIPAESIWNLPENENYRFIGGDVRLESDGFGWIEIPQEMVAEHFDEVV